MVAPYQMHVYVALKHCTHFNIFLLHNDGNFVDLWVEIKCPCSISSLLGNVCRNGKVITQVITSPTHISTTSVTLIYHIYTTHPPHFIANKVGVLSASDHFPVAMLRKRSSTKAAVPCAMTYRQYKHFDA